MIPEYKLFHGAVLAELVHKLDQAVSIDELVEEGRLSSYVLENRFGLQIKHSGSRLHPWQFTFTKSNLVELIELQSKFEEVFVVFVCNTDGMVCLTIKELSSILAVGASDQASIRIDRRRNKWYGVYGGGAELGHKKPKGVDMIVAAIQRPAS